MNQRRPRPSPLPPPLAAPASANLMNILPRQIHVERRGRVVCGNYARGACLQQVAVIGRVAPDTITGANLRADVVAPVLVGVGGWRH